MLEIQKALLSGKTLEEVCTPLGIEFKEQNGECIFSYDMIDSSKFKTHPIVMESRGLVLNTEDWSVAAYPFRRFFNMQEECSAKLPEDLSKCRVEEKLDGSLITLRWSKPNECWKVSTRKMLYAEGTINNLVNKTFNDLFWEAVQKTLIPVIIEHGLLHKHLSYSFELTSPYNRIVTSYNETKITLLMVRNLVDGAEFKRNKLAEVSLSMGCAIPKTIPANNWEELLKMQKQDGSALDPQFEGYVIVNETDSADFPRVKCKNPAYVALHHIATSMSERNLLELIKQNAQEDFIAQFPEYEQNVIDMVKGLERIYGIVVRDWNMVQNENDDRKAFALKANGCLFPFYLFALKDNRTCLYQLKHFIMEQRTDSLLDQIKKVAINEQK